MVSNSTVLDPALVLMSLGNVTLSHVTVHNTRVVEEVERLENTPTALLISADYAIITNTTLSGNVGHTLGEIKATSGVTLSHSHVRHNVMK